MKKISWAINGCSTASFFSSLTHIRRRDLQGGLGGSISFPLPLPYPSFQLLFSSSPFLLLLPAFPLLSSLQTLTSIPPSLPTPLHLSLRVLSDSPLLPLLFPPPPSPPRSDSRRQPWLDAALPHSPGHSPLLTDQSTTTTN